MEKVFLISLGCDKNLVDSEYMLASLKNAGYEITDDENDADVIIVNSCCFIADAKQESIETLIEYGKLKETGKLKALVVAGCLGQRYKDEILSEIPEIDAVVGTTADSKIVEAVQSALEGNKSLHMLGVDELVFENSGRINSMNGGYEYLKIAEGCNKRCTYCVIPYVRGSFRSVPMERLLEEAQQIADSFIPEIILVAQETTLYGTDIYGKKMLHELVHKISEIDGIKRIRILYCYPEEIYDELILEIKNNPKVCHYLDLPIQHCSDRILKRMGRRTNKKELLELIAKLRKEIPDIVLRTSLITGFPGEKHSDFVEMKKFLSEARFERLGVFTYSKEEGTPAASFKDQVPEFIKKHRQKVLMLNQRKVSEAALQSVVGRDLEVIVEGRLEDEGVYVCRSYMDTPKVDGYVFVECDEDIISGTMIKVRITDSKKYDLIGEKINEFTE